jgi:stage V sporulation protein G
VFSEQNLNIFLTTKEIYVKNWKSYLNMIEEGFPMMVTDVRIKTFSGTDSKVKALCSVVFDGMFAIHEIRVVDGTNGLFVSMPNRKTAEGSYKDLAHPVTAEARDLLHRCILETYSALAAKESGAA